MGAEDKVDRAVGEAVASFLRLGGGNEARQAADVDVEAFEAFDEIGEMLAREQRGRTYKRDLNPRHRGDEGGAERDLGLAEPDVAADEPVHRAARRYAGDHVASRALIIVVFLIWESVGQGRICDPTTDL